MSGLGGRDVPDVAWLAMHGSTVLEICKQRRVPREVPMHEDPSPALNIDENDTRGLPPPAPRRHVHTRAIVMRGFQRDDGLWDIEGELKDTKTHVWPSWEDGEQPPDVPVHHMLVRVTLDSAYTVQAVAAALPATPFPECNDGGPPLQGLVGASMSRGWRKAIEATLGGVRGCTHLRELLMNLGTVAYQTIGGELRRAEWEALPAPRVHPPLATAPKPHWDKCIGWRLDGEVIRRWAPDFHQSCDKASK